MIGNYFCGATCRPWVKFASRSGHFKKPTYLSTQKPTTLSDWSVCRIAPLYFVYTLFICSNTFSYAKKTTVQLCFCCIKLLTIKYEHYVLKKLRSITIVALGVLRKYVHVSCYLFFWIDGTTKGI